MQTTIPALPVLRRRTPSRTDRVKQMIIAAIPIAAARKAVPDSGKGKLAGGIALAGAALAGAAYKLRGRSGSGARSTDGNRNGFAANNAGPVSPPATHTV